MSLAGLARAPRRRQLTLALALALVLLVLPLLLQAPRLLAALGREAPQTGPGLVQLAPQGAVVIGAPPDFAAEELALERAAQALALERAALERAALELERAALERARERADHQSALLGAAHQSALLGAEQQAAPHRAEPPCWNQTLFRTFSNVTLPEEPSNRVCRRAVSFRGSDALFRGLARKLSEGRCSHTVLLGGSISCGHRLEDNPHKEQRNWPRRHSFLPTLIDLLNARFPCSEGAAGQEQRGQGEHSFSNLCRGGSTTAEAYLALLRSENQDTLRRADLIIVEKSPNDVEAFGGMGVALYSQRAQFTRSRESDSFRSEVLFWVELFLQRARSRFPDAGPIFLEASSFRTWSAAPPFRRDAAAAHLEALEHYDVPQVDMLRMLGPNSYSSRQRFIEEVYLGPDRVHPTFAGHMLIASALAQFLSDVARAWVAQQGRLGAWLLAPPEDQRLPDRGPLVLSPQNMSLVEADPVVQINLADEQIIRRVIAAADPGWAFAADREPRPRMWTTQTKSSCTVLRAGSVLPSFVMVDLMASSKETNFSAVNLTVFQRGDCGLDGDGSGDNDNDEREPAALPAVKDWLRGAPLRVLSSEVIDTHGYGKAMHRVVEENGGSTQIFTFWLQIQPGARPRQHCPLFVLACETTARASSLRAQAANLVMWAGLTVFGRPS